MSVSYPSLQRRGGAIEWMADNSVAANLLMFVLLAGGVVSGLLIKKEVFPDFDLDQVAVNVSYPGASPSEVEQGILLAVEEAVRGLDGVKEVRSTAQEGFGSVTVEALLGTDIRKLSQEIKQEVDRITSFPEEAEEPQVVVPKRRRPVLKLLIHGRQSEAALRATAEFIRDRLLQNPRITQADLKGVRPLEISIEVSREKLRAYNLTPGMIAERIRRASIELPGGGIKTRGGEILLRVKERRDYGRQFANIPVITRPDGAAILLGSIATITDGFRDTDQFTSYNGESAIQLGVFRVGDQTPVDVADAVREDLERFRAELPEGIGIAIQSDFSQYYRQRMSLLLKNGAMGLGLVLLLLGLFLEARLAFWVTMGIPISFMGALLLLPGMDVSINMVTMFAFIISLGIVVDDAIVVGENVHTLQSGSINPLEGAKQGAREVLVPVTFSVLTNCVAFMPLFFVPGFMGKVFRMIPAVVVLAFLISLVESLFILPAHLGHGRNDRGRPGSWLRRKQREFSEGLTRFLRGLYGPLLRQVLRFRYLTLAVGLALLTLTVGYIGSRRLGFSPFPRIESDRAEGKVVLPFGSPVERTRELTERIRRAAREVADENGGDKLVSGIYTFVGGSARGVNGGHVGDVTVYLTPPGVRPMNTGEFVDRWRERVGSIPGVETLSFVSDAGGPGRGAALTVELSHPNVNTLDEAGSELAGKLDTFDKVKDVDDGFSPGKEQFNFRLQPDGQALGLTAADVARQVRQAFYGAEVLRQQRGRNEVKVMVRLPRDERISEQDLKRLRLQTPAGKEILIEEAVRIQRGRAYNVITRRDSKRTISVQADVNPPSETETIRRAITEETLPQMVARYPGLSYSFEGRQREMMDSIQSLFVGFVAALFAIYALIAVPLKSYIQPAIILFGIPFGIVGAVVGHMFMGYSLSIISVFGIVALSGVVVNDALVLIDFANRSRRTGAAPFEAIHSAGVRRLRPIILTTLTTFFGLLPMIFETSRQARFLIPMAISLGYGILFATLITLLLVPSLYLIVEDFRTFLNACFSDAARLVGLAPAPRDEASGAAPEAQETP